MMQTNAPTEPQIQSPHVQQEPLWIRAEKIKLLFQQLLSNPLHEEFVWQYATQIRAFFHRHWSGGSRLGSFSGNIRLWIDLADHIESQIFLHEMQEGDRGQVRCLKRIWTPGMCFLDIGANIGVQSLLAAQHLGNEGSVHAFEPVQRLAQRLRTNLALNRFSQVQVHPIALSDQFGSTNIWIPRHNNLGMSSLHASTGDFESETIQTSRLDDWTKEQSIHKIDLIKIDVEGHELHVLLGGLKVLRVMRPIITLELSRTHLQRAQTSPEAITDFLVNLGYIAYGISDQGDLISSPQWIEHQNALFAPKELSLNHIQLKAEKS